MSVRAIALLVMLLPAGPALCQSEGQNPPAPADGKTLNPEWSFDASVFTYFVPYGRDYVQPTFTADRGNLHFQVRYNYENLKTGSAWVGYKFRAGKKVELEFTPAVGGVFGDTNGIAPGWSFSLSYWRLNLSSESEYLFDFAGKENNFFYTWSELTVSPMEWLRAGLVVQRTRAYQTDVDVQRGLTGGVTYKRLDVASYILNLDRRKQTYVFSVAINF
jgi:hypothetical protein